MFFSRSLINNGKIGCKLLVFALCCLAIGKINVQAEQIGPEIESLEILSDNLEINKTSSIRLKVKFAEQDTYDVGITDLGFQFSYSVNGMIVEFEKSISNWEHPYEKGKTYEISVPLYNSRQVGLALPSPGKYYLNHVSCIDSENHEMYYYCHETNQYYEDGTEFYLKNDSNKRMVIVDGKTLQLGSENPTYPTISSVKILTPSVNYVNDQIQIQIANPSKRIIYAECLMININEDNKTYQFSTDKIKNNVITFDNDQKMKSDNYVIGTLKLYAEDYTFNSYETDAYGYKEFDNGCVGLGNASSSDESGIPVINQQLITVKGAADGDAPIVKKISIDKTKVMKPGVVLMSLTILLIC